MAKTKPSEYRISRKSLLIWGAGAIAVLIWIFVLGILVGRGTAPAPFDPRKLEKELAEVKAALLKKQQQQVEAVAAGKAGGMEMDFFKNLKQTGSEPHIDIPPPVRPRAGAGKGPQRLKALKRKTRNSAAARPEASPARTASGTGAATETGAGYTVQVASVKDPASAAKLAAALAARGFEAFQIKVDLGAKGTWYRIRVGRFADRQAAVRTAARLKQMKYAAMVVRR